ncbi:hypothetical protein F5Y17DRAFT_468985 [Xylariaceae sp. FL0594]|nr:hypothetical protein F5Y17DRAFT_468985 [Xylariaceae sp. FL0594]
MTTLSNDTGATRIHLFDPYALPRNVRDSCDDFVRARYTGDIRPAPLQGYCSYTLFVGDEVVVQLRPPAYKLDMSVAKTACRVFGSLAPETEDLGQLDGTTLHVFSMRRLPGVSLLEYRAKLGTATAQEQIVKDFAYFQALAWRQAQPPTGVRQQRGVIGLSLGLRLKSMCSRLPEAFRSMARYALDSLPDIEALPWVFTHGDLLPANVMVSLESGKLTGLLDWAEGEWLPFGTGLYGLEELLGEDDKSGCFVYYPDCGELRKSFWKELRRLIPELSTDERLAMITRRAQMLGILLWYGIAFDDGKLDRVVEEGRDNREIQRLGTFLLALQFSEQCK